MSICGEPRELWILNVSNKRQRHCDRLPSYRRHEVASELNDG